jgi:hypothetical protein
MALRRSLACLSEVADVLTVTWNPGIIFGGYILLELVFGRSECHIIGLHRS